MKNEDTSLITKQNPTDHIMNVLKAILSGVPFGGGIIASLIGDYIPKSRERKTVEFLGKVAEDLEHLKDQVQTEYIKTEEFEYLFQKAWKVAVEHYQEEKIEGFRAILLNAAIGKPASEDEKDLFINVLNELTGFHFSILKILKDPLDWNRKNGDKVKPLSLMVSLNQIFKKCLPEWDEERIALIIDDLHRKNLISMSSSALKVMQTGGGIEKLNNKLTGFGRKFVDYVTLQS